MGAFDGFKISVSGMDAQMKRLRVISSNIANARSTRSATGEVYRRKDVVFSAVPVQSGQGAWEDMQNGLNAVETTKIVEDQRPLKRMFQPSHPDADKDGFVEFPNVEPFEEMINMMDAQRSYEANVTVFNSTKDMLKKALEIGR